MPAPATPSTAPGALTPLLPLRPALPAAQRESLHAALEDYLAEVEGRLAISVHDLSTGATFTHNLSRRFITGSLVKLNILLVLLLQAQDEGRTLTEEERSLATRMIRYSDNNVTDVLYARIGFGAGLSEGNERFGLSGTVPGQANVWGATTTTASDQIRLLRAVFTEASPLSVDARRYVAQLLGSVAPEQAWGVSVAAGGNGHAQLKNGWVPRDSDGGRWAINSAGHVRNGDHTYLIAVLSDHHLAYGDGVTCVEEVVARVVHTLESAAELSVPSGQGRAEAPWPGGS
ncbi:serine hydrolase [Salinactinospora qingdaonensis]|uniref:serine hydrolase n=1 Tax=Salinactinospora qingdaonensis TaxID=702744 RepID=UPI0031ECC532